MDDMHVGGCVAFTGHRRYAGEADGELAELLERLYADGFRRFLTGMAWGFDLAAGRAVMELRRSHPDVILVAVEPYAEFRSLFRGADATAYDEVKAAAGECVAVCGERSAACYMRRNDFLVENSSLVVAWYDGSARGGTAYTVRRALRRATPVMNLYPSRQLSLFR